MEFEDTIELRPLRHGDYWFNGHDKIVGPIQGDYGARRHVLTPKIDNELEAIKAKFPECSVVKIISGSCAGENHLVKKVERIGSKKEIAVWFMTNTWMEPEKLEPYVEDTELEEARKKFPVGSYFKINDSFSPIFKVAKSDIERDSRFPEVINIPTYDGNNFIWFNSRICTPFPLPVWRCCEADKPKKNGYYYTRDKRDNSKRYGFYNFNHYDNSNYEWLDEGEL